MTRADERAMVIRAMGIQFPWLEEAPLPALQALHGVCELETGVGKWWKGAGVGSNNAGAVQGGAPPCNPNTSFLHVDSSPNSDGTSTPYQWCFRKYPTLADGIADVARIMYREIELDGVRRRPALEAAMIGDLYGVSAAMYAQRYYEGTGPTVAIRIERHYKALLGAVTRIGKALGEPLPAGVILPPATIRRGSRGELVKTWQRILNDWRGNDADLVVDGIFGKYTEARTREWQLAHGLKADGVTGPLTWRAAEAANAQREDDTVSILDAEADTNPGSPSAKHGNGEA